MLVRELPVEDHEVIVYGFTQVALLGRGQDRPNLGLHLDLEVQVRGLLNLHQEALCHELTEDLLGDLALEGAEEDLDFIDVELGEELPESVVVPDAFLLDVVVHNMQGLIHAGRVAVYLCPLLKILRERLLNHLLSLNF